MKNTNEQKKKPYRSAWSNAIWSFRGMLKNAPQSFWLMAAGVPLALFISWSEIKLPALVVSEVTQKQTFAHAAVAVGVLIALTFAAAALRGFCSTVLEAYMSKYRYSQSLLIEQKSMSCFYQEYEKKSVRDLATRGSSATWMQNGKVPLCEMPIQSMEIIKNVLCYFMFGTIISFVSPWLVVLLTVLPAINWLCVRAYQKYEYNTRAERTDIDKKISYVTQRASDFAAAKDIRVYGMAQWLREIYNDLFKESDVWLKRLNYRNFVNRIVDIAIILVRDGAAYAVLISMALRGEITVDQFVLYFAAISNFATYIGNIMTAWNDMQAASLKVCDFREYLDLPDCDGSGKAHADDFISSAPEITFEHVCFRYDGAEKNTLDDINFTFRPGERIALVGMNGAGKTTLVKLLCGLYKPTSGDIKINGVSVNDFCRDDYYRLFSPVFQDVQTAFFSLAETVAGALGGEVDKRRAEECMRKAGLGTKIDSLPDGIDTKLDKQVNKNGIELSGGEAQKLMMARALYKDAPVLVLDEPTAALDPIAENEIYLHYRDMTAGKTSLFISHRLASTQFCDRVLLLSGGKITEEGTHDELIASGGEYSKLYEIQSCWYRDDYKGGEQQ